MTIHGYRLIEDWKVSNIGFTAIAERGGKRFFLKKYGEYKMPRRDASTNARLFDKLKKEFESFRDNRIAINKALASIAGSGGNIILPSDWFVDDIYFIEATEFVPGLIEDTAIFSLPRDKILFLMMTAAGAISSIHRKNIVHSDLKRTNIMAADKSGKAVAKIIDFDRAYFADRIRPDELGGDQCFMSPELAQCFMYDMADEALAYLSTKSDIFSLGLVFHNYLTGGGFPRPTGLSGVLKERADSGQPVFCCEVLLAGGGLEVSSSIGDEYLGNLLVAMLQPEPEDRPDANEVLEILKNKRVREIKEGSVVTVAGRRPSARTGVPESRTSSEPARADAHETTPTVPSGYCAPWGDHRIVFSEEKLAAGGYVASEQFMKGDKKCYRLFKEDGTSRVFTMDTVCLSGFATLSGLSDWTSGSERRSSSDATRTAPATPERSAGGADIRADEGASADEPAEGYEYDMDVITSSGYKSITKGTKNGKSGFFLTKLNDDQRFMTFDQLKMLRFIKKK